VPPRDEGGQGGADRAVTRELRKFARGGKGPPPEKNPQERAALHKLRVEAHRAGALLHDFGRGGLPSSLCLHVMRRDQYRCKVCGTDGQGCGGLTLHHKGGIVESAWLDNQGHKNKPSNLVTICGPCHDRLHDKARAEGVDSSQVEPKGDE
jgi:5-methylcytosine-specific restriction endonuclease McrA